MTHLHIINADETLQERIASEWGEMQARHMHIADGFALVAFAQDRLAGLISICWKVLPTPLPVTREAFVDIIEVHPNCRRQGIAARLVELSIERAKNSSAYQIRAWSSEDKTEAILLWKRLGFSLCPAVIYSRGQEIRGYFAARTL